MKKFFKRTSHESMPERRRVSAVERPLEQPKLNGFRRGRTLTGSRSALVASSNENNAALLSPRAHVHHLTKHRRHMFARFMVAAFLALLLYLFLHQFVATVRVTSDASVTLSEAKRNAYQDRIDAYYARHVSERFRPALRDAALTEFLQEVYPEISSLHIAMSGEFGKAITRVELRQPVARWVIGGRTEYVDKTGIVFGYNVHKAPSLTIIDKNRVVDSSGLVASHRFLAFVGQAVGDGRERGLVVTSATIPLLTTRQLELHFRGISYEFRLTVDRSGGEQIEDAARIIRYLKQKQIHPDYVDVRVKGKAFYK